MIIEMMTLTQDVINATTDELAGTGLASPTRETDDTYMSVRIARRLMVLLRNLLRSNGHRKSVVNKSVTELEKVSVAVEMSEEGCLTDRKPRGERER